MGFEHFLHVVHSEREDNAMQPKFIFQLGKNMDSVQITPSQLIVNGTGETARAAQTGDFIKVAFDRATFYGVVSAPPDVKDGNVWLVATRANFG